MIQWVLAIWYLVLLPYKSSLENFEHYFDSMWNECNCAVVWTFFGPALLWDWSEKWPFPVLWPLLSFPDLRAYWVQHFNSIIFGIWNSSAGIPSLSLALLVLMLPKAYLTLHSRMAGSKWVITPLWLSVSLRPFLYSFSVYLCHLFLISSTSIKSIPFLSFIVPIVAWIFHLVSLIFFFYAWLYSNW